MRHIKQLFARLRAMQVSSYSTILKIIDSLLTHKIKKYKNKKSWQGSLLRMIEPNSTPFNRIVNTQNIKHN